MTTLAEACALLAIIASGVVYGTDTFCAVVLRSALSGVDDATLTTVMGNVHRYGDRRLPVPGVLGIVAALAATILAALAGQPAGAAAAGAGLVLLVAWVGVYLRISAPINRRLTAAADQGEALQGARLLQTRWDRVIVPRAGLQGAAIALLGISLIVQSR